MNKLTDLNNILNESYMKDKNFSNTSDSVYEILKREKNMKEVLNRLTDYETKKELEKQFINTKFSDILNNIFKVLNEILEDFIKTEKITLNKIKKTLNKEKRIIYIGIFMIVCSIFLALIEISDSV